MNINRKILEYAAAWFLLYLVYYCWFVIYVPTGKMDLMNILIFYLSLVFIVLGLHVLQKELSISGFFLIVYFATLAVNQLNLNIYQEYKTFTDIYFFFGGGLLFAYLISLRFTPQVKLPNLGINVCWIEMGISLLYLFLQIYIYMETGLRFFSDEWSSLYSENYVIPGVSGLVEVLRWCSLMFMAESDNKLFKIWVIISTLVSTILSAKRGDAMRILFFLGVLYFYKMDFSKKRKIMLKVVATIMVLLLIHSAWGSYREMRRGATEEAVAFHNKRNITNIEFIRWAYGYSAMSFETLKQAYIEREYENNYGIGALKNPLIRITGGNKAIMEEEKKYKDISMAAGFNAATFLCRFVKDGGYLFFIGVTIQGVYIAFLDSVCNMHRMIGGHAFLLMLTFISTFGNYYLNTSYFYALHLYIIINLFFCGRKRFRGG